MAVALRDSTPALPEIPPVEKLEDVKELRAFLVDFRMRIEEILDDLLFIESSRAEIRDSRERLRTWKEDT